MSLNPKTFRTLEFLLVIVANAAAWAAQITDTLPTRYAVYASAASGAFYALSRGLAKLNEDTKDYWNTTEFWVAILASIPAVVAAAQDIIPATHYALIQGIVAALVAVGAGLRKQPFVAADVPPFAPIFPTIGHPVLDPIADEPVDPTPDTPDGDDSVLGQ